MLGKVIYCMFCFLMFMSWDVSHNYFVDFDFILQIYKNFPDEYRARIYLSACIKQWKSSHVQWYRKLRMTYTLKCNKKVGHLNQWQVNSNRIE